MNALNALMERTLKLRTLKNSTLLMFVVTSCIAAALGCGGSAAPDTSAREASAAATQLPSVGATAGVREGAGQTARGRGRAASGLEVVIDSCGWEEGDDLQLQFTIENTEDVLRFGNFRLQSSTGTIYRPPGVKSDISVPPGETRQYRANTDKFPRGSVDLSLVVSDARRESHTESLGTCAHP